MANYTQIDLPYDDFLNRAATPASTDQLFNLGETDNSTASSSSDTTTSGGDSTDNGNVETQAVKNDGSIGDVWIKNFIRSENWQPKTAGFYIDGQTGKAEFSNVYVSGNIQALTGLIGGFTIGATNLSATSGGNTTIVSSGSVAFTAGPTGAPTFTVTQSGVLTATLGVIGGWTIGSTTLSASTMILDAGNQQIRSTNYTSGVFGSGFLLSSDLLEVGNIEARGLIRTAVFQKDVVNVMGGNFAVLDGDALDQDMTSLD